VKVDSDIYVAVVVTKLTGMKDIDDDTSDDEMAGIFQGTTAMNDKPPPDNFHRV
jgi:hypothetical protein